MPGRISRGCESHPFVAIRVILFFIRLWAFRLLVEKVEGVGVGGWGLGLGVWGLGFTAQGVWVWGLGFGGFWLLGAGVWDSECRF